MALAPIVSRHANLSAGEPVCRQKLFCRARALTHRDLPAMRHQRLNDAREHRDAEAAGDADGGPLTVELEAAPERAQQVHLVTLMADGQPGAARPDDVEDEADASAHRIGPGGAVRPAQDRVWGTHRELEELPGIDRDGRRRMVEHE